MTIDDVRKLYAYDEWANARVVEVIASLSDEQLTSPLESSFPSILATFAHIVSSEWVWLQRFQGVSPTSVPAWADDPDLSHLRDTLAVVEAERRALMTDFTEADLQSTLSYRTISGDARTNRLLDLLLHVVNHSTYHRGQLTTMLRQVGSAPAATDYVLFKWLQDG